MGKLNFVLALVLTLALGYFLGLRQGSQDRENAHRETPDHREINRSFGNEPDPVMDPSRPLSRIMNPRASGLTKSDPPKSSLKEGSSLVEMKGALEGPLEKLLELIEGKHYAEAMELLQSKDFGDDREDALVLRARVASHLATEMMSVHQRGEAKDLITRERNLQPTDLGLLEAELKWYREVGRRPEAIKAINHVLQLSLPPKDRDLVLAWRHDLMSGHLKLLSEGEQWRELSDFLAGDPAPGGDRYYLYQLWAARAHTELFEFSRAKSALEMAVFDVDLLNEVEQAREYIEKLQVLRHERVSLDEKEAKKFPILTQSAGHPSGEWVALKATWIQDSIIVDLKIGKKSIPLLVDTGASLTSLDRRVKKHLSSEVIQELGGRSFHTANGTTTGEVSRIGKVQLGPFVVNSVDIAFMQGLKVKGRYVGLLGMNVLRYFDFKFDEGAGVVRLREKP